MHGRMLSAALASTCSVMVTLLSPVVTIRSVSRLPNVPWWRQGLLNHPWLRTTDLGEQRCYDTEVTRFIKAEQLIRRGGDVHWGDLDGSDGHGQDVQSAQFMVTAGESGKKEKSVCKSFVFDANVTISPGSLSVHLIFNYCWHRGTRHQGGSCVLEPEASISLHDIGAAGVPAVREEDLGG